MPQCLLTMLYYHSVNGRGIDKGNPSVSRSWNWWK